MTHTTLITVNAVLDLAVVLAVFAIVRFTHRLHRLDHHGETLHLSQPLPLRLALPADEVEELSNAA
jgi:HAMP domain-containing protein